jgi:hypothetical protein
MVSYYSDESPRRQARFTDAVRVMAVSATVAVCLTGPGVSIADGSATQQIRPGAVNSRADGVSERARLSFLVDTVSDLGDGARIRARLNQLFDLYGDENEGAVPSLPSLRAFLSFIQSRGREIRYPSGGIALTDEGELYATWRGGPEVLSLRFISPQDIQYASRAGGGPLAGRVPLSGLVERLHSRFHALGLAA